MTRVPENNWTVGDCGPVLEIANVNRRHFVQFAGASGDFNPIHYDEFHATAAGHASVFGQGMFSASIVASAAADWFGLSNIKSMITRFESRLWPGDTVRTTGQIISINHCSDAVMITATLDLISDNGSTIVSGTVEARLPD